MAYIPVPKDLSAVKTKVFFNLTKRQIICFGSGALISVPLFFMLKGAIGTSTAALVMIFIMLPFFLLAMYERNGQPFPGVEGGRSVFHLRYLTKWICCDYIIAKIRRLVNTKKGHKICRSLLFRLIAKEKIFLRKSRCFLCAMRYNHIGLLSVFTLMYNLHL